MHGEFLTSIMFVVNMHSAGMNVPLYVKDNVWDGVKITVSMNEYTMVKSQL